MVSLSDVLDSAVASALRPLFITTNFRKLWKDVPNSIYEALPFFLVAFEQRPRRIEQLGLVEVRPLRVPACVICLGRFGDISRVPSIRMESYW